MSGQTVEEDAKDEVHAIQHKALTEGQSQRAGVGSGLETDRLRQTTLLRQPDQWLKIASKLTHGRSSEPP